MNGVIARLAQVAAVTLVLLTGPLHAQARVGMNLDGVTYYSKSYPFIDRMKAAGDLNIDGVMKPAPLDATGNPPATLRNTGLQTIVGLDPEAAGTSRRYVLTWEGGDSIDLHPLCGSVVKRGDHRWVIQGQPGCATIDFRFGFPGTLTGMHLVREDQEELFKAGKVFNPVYVERLKPFDTIRFMDWGRTNNAPLATTWANRPKPENFTWSSANGRGVPLEIMIQLANETHSNMWYNVPFAADDDYITRAVGLIRQTLAPDLKLYVEYANEVWNWGFPAPHLAQPKGVALGVAKVQGGEHMVWYGYRAAQVARLSRDAWGDDPAKRLHNVLGTQQGDQGQLNQYYINPGIERAKVGSPAKLFDAIATTTYFGGAFNLAGEAVDKSTLLGWARNGDAGLDAAFKELEFGGSLKTPSSLANLAVMMRNHKKVADLYGWELVAYEGGAHTTGPPTGNADDDKAMGELIIRMIADPRMGRLYGRMVEIAGQNGATLVASFNEAGSFWGALPTIYDAHSPRYDALVAAAARPGK